VDTDFGEVGGVVGFGWSMFRHFGIPPERGARTPIFCASALGVAGLSGGYFRDCKQVRPDARVADARLRERLWDISERLIASVPS